MTPAHVAAVIATSALIAVTASLTLTIIAAHHNNWAWATLGITLLAATHLAAPSLARCMNNPARNEAPL